MIKIPREGTRVRALFDRLVEDAKMGTTTSWSEAKAAYDSTYSPWRLTNRVGDPRRYSQMEVSRALRKYAKRVKRGEYAMREEYLPAKPPKKHEGERPKLTDICGTCAKPYGKHYGADWPGPSDCPDPVTLLRRPEHARTYWTRSEIQPELAKNPCKEVEVAAPAAPRKVPRECGVEGCSCAKVPDLHEMESAFPPVESKPSLAESVMTWFDLQDPANWKKGDILEYQGGYQHFDVQGYRKGSTFVLERYGKSPKLLDDSMNFVFLQGIPNGHGPAYFKLKRVADERTQQVADLATVTTNQLKRIQELEREVQSLKTARDLFQQTNESLHRQLTAANQRIDKARRALEEWR